MLGYLKPSYRDMPQICKKQYRAFYCGLCHALEDLYYIPGILSLSYEITGFLVVICSLREDPIKTYRGSCSISPFIWVPYVDYTANPISLGATVSILMMGYELEDKAQDRDTCFSSLACRIFRRPFAKAKQTLPKENASLTATLHSFYGLEAVPDVSFFTLLERCGDSVCRLLMPVISSCAEEFHPLLCHLATLLGQWIYLMDACDDAEQDQKKHKFNPLYLEDAPRDRLSALIVSIESEIATCIDTLPIRHDRELVQYLFVIQLPKTSKKLLHDMKL